MNFKPTTLKISLLVVSIAFAISSESCAQCEYCDCINCGADPVDQVKKELLYNAQDMQQFLENAAFSGDDRDEIIDLAIKYIENSRQISNKMNESKNTTTDTSVRKPNIYFDYDLNTQFNPILKN